MSRLLAWQREGYPRYHRDRRNLILHILSAPFFWVGLVLMAVGTWNESWSFFLTGLVFIPLVFAIQGRGHRLEEEAPVPFAGPGDAFKRLMGEQLINFPKFVFSGGWFTALSKAKRPVKPEPEFAMPYGMPPTAPVVRDLPPLPAPIAAPASPPSAAPAEAVSPTPPPPAASAGTLPTEPAQPATTPTLPNQPASS